MCSSWPRRFPTTPSCRNSSWPRRWKPRTRRTEPGVGSGLPAAQVRVLEAHPNATLIDIDANTDMLAAATASLEARRSRLCRSRLQDPLPDGPFDLVVSTLAVHHLDGPATANLFYRVASVLAAGGRFVLAELVVPKDPNDVVTPIDGIDDTPSSLADQLNWLAATSLRTDVNWQHRDLAIITSTKTT